MAIIKTRAIVLRRRLFSETSLVAALLAREGGRFDVLAKGCRRPGSPLFGHLDLCQCEEVVILERPQAGLDLLLEAGFADEHPGLRFFPPAFAAAGLLANLAAEAALPGEPQPGLFEVLSRAIPLLSGLGEPFRAARLSASPPLSLPDKEILLVRTLKLALLDALGWLGFGLELGRCLACGRPPGPGEPAWLDPRRGGLVCRACRPGGGPGFARIGPEALAALRSREAGAARLELALPPAERLRWLGFLLDYCQRVLEKPLKGREVLLQLLKVRDGRGFSTSGPDKG
ncbi:MAG: DNA repair protein RecO C-terminal domain-containing protein [Planctomycetota bacterium]|jgi:DNA repair protein RecO (recombination protein O)|nr:DNA repair protein RecO C-terminal domain-containing protein [Planctomycetota bacterium]